MGAVIGLQLQRVCQYATRCVAYPVQVKSHHALLLDTLLPLLGVCPRDIDPVLAANIGRLVNQLSSVQEPRGFGGTINDRRPSVRWAAPVLSSQNGPLGQFCVLQIQAPTQGIQFAVRVLNLGL